MLKDIVVSKNGDLVITMGTNASTAAACPTSKSGKTKVVSSTGGFAKISTKEFGMVGVNINVTAANA